jgi:ribosomal protein S18 acetylase RimI-like enzyme
MTIADLAPAHLAALARFAEAMPDGDVTFIEEDVRDPAVVEGWVHARPGDRARRWVALDGGGEVIGLAALVPLIGWSSHVGSLRLVVHPAHRGHGVGGALARHALVQAAHLELRKVVVEVVAEQEPAVRLFFDLGFQAEALLHDHIRDRRGDLHDLMVLAHHVDDTWSGMDTVGVTEELGAP